MASKHEEDDDPEHSCCTEGGQAEGATDPAPEGYWWHVNKGGFPVPDDTWERMWQHVIDTHPNGAAIAESIRGKPCRKVTVLA